MTSATTHRYSATLDDDTPLSVSGGNLTLDAGAVPHVQSSITLAVEDVALLDDLDPRDSRRVKLRGSYQWPLGDGNIGFRTRNFDLGIRSTSPDRAAGTVTLELASDEALLADFAQTTDDDTPYDLSSSLRSVVNYVLGKALGASLQATPALNADLTPYWSVTNMLRNPAVRGTVNNWSEGGSCTIAFVSEGTTGAVRVTPTGATGAVFAVDTAKYNLNATPGARYTFELAARREAALGVTLVPVLRFLDAAGDVILDTEGGSFVTGTSYARFGVQGVAPANAVKVAPYVRFITSTGRVFRLDAGILHTSAFPVPHFTGSDASTGEYTFAYQGAADDSPSVRTPVTERDPESLVWRAGVSAMDFLQALLKTVGYRLVCDEQRRWTLRDDSYRAAGTQTWRYGVNITAADENLSRDDETWFDAAVYVYTWTDSDGIAQTRTDSYSLTSTPTKVLRRELRNTPYPGPGRAAQMVSRAQGKGRTVTVSGIPNWLEHTDQELSILLDGTPIQTGISSRVRFDFDTDEVTITSRTTDTPAGAINLLSGSINALTGTINNL